jgi:hypothetical protein
VTISDRTREGVWAIAVRRQRAGLDAIAALIEPATVQPRGR